MNLDKIFEGSQVKRLFIICVGSIILGSSLGFFLAPNKLAPGGTGGLSVMINNFIPLSVGTLSIILNIPLLIIAFIKWGWKFTATTTAAIVISGITTNWASTQKPATDNTILAAIFGGVIMGLGCACVFKAGSTTGGTDIVSRILIKKYPHLKIGSIILSINGCICILSGVVFKNIESSLFSLIALATFTKVLDMILYGSDTAKMVIVISSKSKEISDGLIHQVGIGCTILNGVSGYEHKDSEVLLCAMRKPLLPEARDFILATDEKAFMLIGNVGQVFGKGFITEHSDFF